MYGSTTRFNVRNVLTNFLDDTEILQKVDETIHKLEEHLNARKDIDSAYSEFCDLVYFEMSQKLDTVKTKSNTGSKGRIRLKSKPW